MSHMSESYEEYEAMSQQEAESDAELYYNLLDALQKAKNLGLDSESVKVLCYSAGIDFDNLD